MIFFCPKTLSMIIPTEINQNDIVKILVNEDGLEDEMYGVVGMNTGKTLGIHYLNPSELVYKSACVYTLDTDTTCPAPYESVMEHYPSGTTFEDLNMKPIGTNMFAYYSEIDSNASDSDIIIETDSDLSDFVVSDGENELPPDHIKVDSEWEKWEPATPGAKYFKKVIDNLSARA